MHLVYTYNIAPRFRDSNPCITPLDETACQDGNETITESDLHNAIA
jgi:hypothetical protein